MGVWLLTGRSLYSILTPLDATLFLHRSLNRTLDVCIYNEDILSLPSPYLCIYILMELACGMALLITWHCLQMMIRIHCNNEVGEVHQNPSFNSEAHIQCEIKIPLKTLIEPMQNIK